MVNSTKTKGNVRLDSSSSATPDDICITGIAGSYPDSRSTQELADNLFNKRDLISGDGCRWKRTNLELPKRIGKIWDIEKFDADFFGINFTEAHFMDPMQRILMEKVYESIIDAGINPEELCNTRTGVFVGCLLEETDNVNQLHCVLNFEYGLTAGKRNVLAHRISEWLKLSAPSYSIDSACSSAFAALDNAFFAMKNGDCDMALVCGASICLLQATSLGFARLGVLSYDGICKCFDESANGYARSECIGAFLLQRAKDSRRIYAKVVDVKTNCDGFKTEGVHCPSSRLQVRLLEDFYSQSGVDPAQIEFVEAHATGTRVGDPIECNAMYNVFCKNRKGPLLVGSVKSNLGHCEGSSGICSISKAVIAYNTGALPPNINYKTPRIDIPALVDGLIKVVDEPTPWNRGYFATSGFGFGGANVHTLLENVSKSKVNQGLPADNLPRLVSFSNRTENGLKKMNNYLEAKPIDVDEVRLWHAIFKSPERRNTYRGYILMGSNPKRGVCIAKGMETKKVKRPKVCFKYSALLTNWTVIAQELLSIPVFATSLDRSFLTLEKKGHNTQVFLKNTAIARQYSLLGSVVVCIALTDVLKAVGITPDYIIGEDIGELCSAYADESLTAEQTILVAYEYNKALEAMFAKNTVPIKQVKEVLNCNLSKDLKNNLQQLIPDTATNSERWLTQSSRSEFTLSEYLLHSLANPASPNDTLSNINNDAVVIEIGFSDNVLGIPIVENDADNIENLLKLLGNLYLRGLDLNLAVLYPDVPFPVSQGTPMLSHLVGWNHDDNCGTRIMGLTHRGITNLAECDDYLLWPFPDEWTFTEAATVPVAYATVYAALVLMGKMRKGESILIHAGTGAVGQAAINVALHHGLEVFTTVGTPAKRAFIRRMFPQISDSHIGSSRDFSFEEMIRRETKGEGVDLVLNSLAEEILQASAKCLKRGGRFLEIGKYDIIINTEIEMCFLNKGVSFYGVMLDYLHRPEAAIWKKNIKELIKKGIKEGAVRPISYCVFEKSEIETAFRYMSAGKHIGKVVIKIRPDDPVGTTTKPTFYPIKALPRYTCHREFEYVIVGGLGGFGLELADWLVMRGARKIVFSSRMGVSNGYQALHIKFWQNYETEIKVATADVTSEAGCQELLQLASSMGTVRAIFNLAVVLRDAIFNNQTPETFRESFAPKAQATINLDKFSRLLCPELKEFVVFSSVSCGRGNAGQSNYGYSNSVMERVCEIRRDDGLPALAIQWGAIGDVGLVADMQEENIQMEIGGTLQQRILSCMDALDILLRQDATIVSSIVVAEKRTGGSGSRNVVDVIANILGITDLKTTSRQVPLAEMGMDSVMAVEIKQTLERDYELFFNAQEIRMLTFTKLMEAESAQSAEIATKTSQTTDVVCPDEFANTLLRNFGDEKLINEECMALPSLASDDQNDNNILSNKIMFMLPGIECCASVFKTLCSRLKIKNIGIQVGLNNHGLDEMVDKVYKIIKERLNPGDTFYIAAYSFGTCLLLPLIQRLEDEDYRGIAICIDGSPDMLQNILNQLININDERELQNYIVVTTFSSMIALGSDKFQEKLNNAKSFEDMINICVSMSNIIIKSNYSIDFLLKMGFAALARIKIVLNYNLAKVTKILSPVILIRQKAIESATLNQSYHLDKYTSNPVEIYEIPCDHSNIIDKLECAEIINSVLEKFVEAQSEESIKNQQNTARQRAAGII